MLIVKIILRNFDTNLPFIHSEFFVGVTAIEHMGPVFLEHPVCLKNARSVDCQILKSVRFYPVQRQEQIMNEISSVKKINRFVIIAWPM